MIKYKSNKPAIIMADRQITYQELAGGILQYSRQMESIQQERVVIFSENRPEWIFALYSAWHQRGIVVPIDFKSNAEDAAYILKDCTPKIIFHSNGTSDVMEKAIELAGYQGKTINLDDLEAPEAVDERPCESPGDAEDTALIIYTSGTTGSPKGVMLTYGNLIANITAVHKDVPIYNGDDRVMILLPLHHIFPLLGTVAITMYIGATAVICPRLLPADIMETLQTHAITIVIGVPRLYESFKKSISAKINASGLARSMFGLAGRIGSLGLSKKLFGKVQRGFGGSVRYMVSGGSRLEPDTALFFRTLGFDILEGYGMTESSPMITFTRPGAFMAGSAGQRLPSTRIEIRDGEITAAGENIMKGYYNRPEETAEVLRDGWLYTGDLGHLNETGHLFVTGRSKEILVLSSGKNINPVEIEGSLELLDPIVAEVAVTLVDDRLHAIIRPEPEIIARETSVNPRHLLRTRVIDEYNRSASPHKIIQGLTVTERELPRTSMGKLRRFMLDDYVEDSSMERTREQEYSLPDFEEQTVIRNYLSSLVGREVLPGDHLDETLGMDSLDKVTFQVFLKKTFGLELELSELSTMESVGAIAAMARERGTQIEISEVNWADVFQETTHVRLPSGWFTKGIFKFFAVILLKVYFRCSAENVDKLPDGPCIITPNHQSFLDGLLVAAFMRQRHFGKLYFYAKAKHFKSWWLKFIADRHNVIVMDINKDVKGSLQKLAEVLKQGRKIMIFPEGTRSLDGKMGDFRKTFAILSRELSVPVVPVTINGAREALPPGAKIPRPFKRIRVTFQDPVYPGDETYESLAERIKAHVQSKLSK